jgi:hypothetical protein
MRSVAPDRPAAKRARTARWCCSESRWPAAWRPPPTRPSTPRTTAADRGSTARGCGGRSICPAAPRRCAPRAASRPAPAVAPAHPPVWRHAHLHLRQLRQRAEEGGRRLALHAQDRHMHPDHRDQHQHEQRHEAAGPQPGQVEQGAEQDRQNEAAQAADHADQTAHRADMLRVVDRDVLVDRRLAQGHEETEHEDDDDETGQPHFEVEREGLLHPVHHVVGRWIGEQKGGDDGDEEGPVEHPPRAVGIGEVATIGAEEAGRNREGSAAIIPALLMSSW